MRELARLVGHPRGAAGLAFAPDGATLASAGRDGHVIFWDLRPVAVPGAELAARVGERYGVLLEGADLHLETRI